MLVKLTTACPSAESTIHQSSTGWPVTSAWKNNHQKGSKRTDRFDLLCALDEDLKNGSHIRRYLVLINQWIGPSNRANFQVFAWKPEIVYKQTKTWPQYNSQSQSYTQLKSQQISCFCMHTKNCRKKTLKTKRISDLFLGTFLFETLCPLALSQIRNFPAQIIPVIFLSKLLKTLSSIYNCYLIIPWLTNRLTRGVS